jgi:hypothetical protein
VHKSTAPSGMNAGTIIDDTIWGAMGSAIIGAGPVKAGGGAWLGTGVGERVPLEASDAANPIFSDSTLELRKFRGYYANLQGEFMDNFLTVGGGILYVQPTAVDQGPMTQADVLDHQDEYHVTYQHKFDAIVLNAEYMHCRAFGTPPRSRSSTSSAPASTTSSERAIRSRFACSM